MHCCTCTFRLVEFTYMLSTANPLQPIKSSFVCSDTFSLQNFDEELDHDPGCSHYRYDLYVIILISDDRLSTVNKIELVNSQLIIPQYLMCSRRKTSTYAWGKPPKGQKPLKIYPSLSSRLQDDFGTFHSLT
jgi:hypothetical protein